MKRELGEELEISVCEQVEIRLPVGIVRKTVENGWCAELKEIRIENAESLPGVDSPLW